MEKKLWVGLTVLVLLLIGTSFAWWYWNSTTNTNVSLTVEGIDITYVGGSDITGVNLIPVSSKEKGIEDNTAIEKVVTASSNSTTYMNLYLTLETLPDGLKDKSFVYEVYNGANLVGKGNFQTYNEGDKVQIASAQKITSSQTSFQLYIWIDGNVDNPSGMMNQTFKFVLSADASDNTPSQQTLTKLGVTVNNTEVNTFGKIPYVTESELTTLCTNAGYQDLTSCLTDIYEVSTYSELMATGYVSTVNDNGVFAAEDDLGISYYYRGNVENNYVYFADNYWRIMRINGDGTIRMIYDGPTKKHNGITGEDNIVTNTQYNTEYNDNKYVSYGGLCDSGMSPASLKQQKVVAIPMNMLPGQECDSMIKIRTDNWYYSVIVENGYDKYVADAIYCNDRKVTPGTYFRMEFTGDGTGTTKTAYDSMARMYGATVSPSLKCSQENDRFSVTDIGNGDLTYPIGLATIDELVMSGYFPYDLANDVALPSLSSYSFSVMPFWTMSPAVFYDGLADVWIVYNGFVNPDIGVEFSAGLRPVVSLKSDTPFSSGDGSYEQPFVVGE